MPPPLKAPNWLAGGGKMAEVLCQIDWSKNPLGPLASWPQSLRTAVSLCLASNFPISIAWGSQFNQVYNDGYWPICGAKHPVSMGQDFRICWASPWPVIGESFERAVAGQSSYLSDQRMFLDRNGYPEETCFTFSFSPIRDESGGVGGLFHPVIETTANMLNSRRSRTLRDLAAAAGKAQSFREAKDLCLRTLQDASLDLPFVLLYEIGEGSAPAKLAGHTGLSSANADMAPQEIFWERDVPRMWPLGRLVRGQSGVEHIMLKTCMGPIHAGPYEEPLEEALILPITPPGASRPLAIVVLGISSRRRLDDSYRNFLDMVASGFTVAVSNARSYQQERGRAEALAALDRSKTAFFSNISHEFRTPLTLMLGPVRDLLEDTSDALSQRQRETLVVVQRNALRLLKLVGSLLDFSRLEAGRLQANLQAVDLTRLTEDLCSSFRSAFERAGLRFEVLCAPIGCLVSMDVDLWEKIVFNLLSNALKYTHEGSVTVKQKDLPPNVVLEVTDTGSGIPADQISTIFERFRRVEQMHGRTHEGSGIGLALVHELAKLLGGDVQVESTLHQGSTFRVSIPYRVAPADEVLNAVSVRKASPGAEAYLGEALMWVADDRPSESAPPAALLTEGRAVRHLILLADDNADMRAYISRLLSAEFEVVAVKNGALALQQAKERRPDLLLTDIMMPVLDGIGLLRSLRADAQLRTLPVILLSARAGNEAKIEGIALGADDYLVKPFSAQELLARIHTQLKLFTVRQQDAKQSAAEANIADLKRMLGVREAFVRVASHELNTPLTSLKLQVQAALRRAGRQSQPSEETERHRRMLTKIDEQLSRLAHLVGDMLDLSRLETGKLTLHPVPCELSDIARQVHERMIGHFRQANMTLHLETLKIAPGMWDPFRIEQIILNLLTNAIRYGENKPVFLRVDCEPPFAKLTVSDQGRGVAPADQARIFKAFERAVSAQEISGLGVGLYIANEISQAHGGRLEVESLLGQGASFHLYLPMADERR